MNFKKWVKSIQTAGYNAAHTVFKVSRKVLLILLPSMGCCVAGWCGGPDATRGEIGNSILFKILFGMFEKLKHPKLKLHI